MDYMGHREKSLFLPWNLGKRIIAFTRAEHQGWFYDYTIYKASKVQCSYHPLCLSKDFRYFKLYKARHGFNFLFSKLYQNSDLNLAFIPIAIRYLTL